MPRLAEPDEVPGDTYARSWEMADELLRLRAAASQALRTLDAVDGSRQLAADVLRAALDEHRKMPT